MNKTNHLFIPLPDGEQVQVLYTLINFSRVRSTVGHTFLNLNIMRTCEKKNQKTSTEVKTRRLKIQPKTIHNTWTTSCFPEIKLSGKWLQEHGFEAGSEVVVAVEPKRLVITLE